MRITEIELYDYEARYAHGHYAMSRGRVSSGERSLVIRVSTDDGLDGWAETCPNGRTYLPSFVEGEHAALTVLANAVLGLDPRNLAELNAVMSQTLLGSLAAKGALDMACWDIFGQSVGLPVHAVLGGRTQDTFPVFLAVPTVPGLDLDGFLKREGERGVRVFQVKVGDAWQDDVARVRAVVERLDAGCTVLADANGGWNLQSALLAARALEGLPVRLEQPCRTMTDCGQLSRRTSLPLVLDECVTTMDDLMRAKYEVGAAGINLKLSRVGGYTPARAIRDAAQGLDLSLTIDDTWGGSLTTTQNAQFAANCQPANLVGVSLFGDWTEPRIAPAPRMGADGRAAAPDTAGLGVTVDLTELGEPTFRAGTAG
jgi:L-alanine-DL-glutamate epimerase-like enolase superfamily enzyme